MSDQNIANRGGGFLIADPEADEVFTPEQLSDEQRMIGRTTRDFVEGEVRPSLEEMENGDHERTVELLRHAGELGLLGGDIPESFGGLGLDKVATTLITENMARGASFAISFGAHTGIGTLPIVLFGSESQKKRYLPDLASGKRIAAYALTEPDAGSDALAGKTGAYLTEDGKAFRLTGEKQWITNAGFADLFIVYAKVDGEKMTAFIVERGFEGVSVGPEFKKMGLHGSSTCSVYLSDVIVPVDNVLGEIGRGHVIAFNILNIGRWKLAAGCLGSCKTIIEISAEYARGRRQFGRPISEFPAIQQKLAQMAARTFALESMVYRTAGLFDRSLAAVDGTATEGVESAAAAIREYAIEASVNKVFGSETLDFVADEGVQIHGGYGYMREFEVERAYRDSRINRIFEGTNEINRLLVPGTLLRRAMKGELPVMEAFQRVQSELSSLRPVSIPNSIKGNGMESDSPLAPQVSLLAAMKRATLMVAGLGVTKYLNRVEEEQEFLMAVADLAILTYALESALLRARQMYARSDSEVAEPVADLTSLIAEWAMDQAEIIARRTLAGLEEGDKLQVQLSVLRRLFRRTPVNTVKLGRRIAERVLEGSAYPAGHIPVGV